MTDEVIRVLHEFPAIWAFLGFLGTVTAGIVFWLLVGRKINPMYGNVVKDLGNANNLLIESHTAQLQMQKKHYEDELAYERLRFSRLEAERNDYRIKLHDANDAHHATTLKLTELEARPNVDQVYKGQQEFFRGMSKHMDEQTKTMQAIHKSIVDHDEGIEMRTSKIIDPVKDMCSEVAKALDRIAKNNPA